jgi:hypothetical protein
MLGTTSSAQKLEQRITETASDIESAIGALQSGNALERCRDRSEIGFERDMALAVLRRNLHTLGRLLIAETNPKCDAAFSRRQPA